MIEVGAEREVLISRQDDKWGLAIRLGGAGSRWLPVRSRREALRRWASLTAVGCFAESLGARSLMRATSARYSFKTLTGRNRTSTVAPCTDSCATSAPLSPVLFRFSEKHWAIYRTRVETWPKRHWGLNSQRRGTPLTRSSLERGFQEQQTA